MWSAGLDSNLAFDAGGNPVIAYLNEHDTGDYLALAAWNGSRWERSGGSSSDTWVAGHSLGLAIGSVGTLVLSYDGGDDAGLIVERSTGGPWIPEAIDAASWVFTAAWMDMAMPTQKAIRRKIRFIARSAGCTPGQKAHDFSAIPAFMIAMHTAWGATACPAHVHSG